MARPAVRNERASGGTLTQVTVASVPVRAEPGSVSHHGHQRSEEEHGGQEEAHVAEAANVRSCLMSVGCARFPWDLRLCGDLRARSTVVRMSAAVTTVDGELRWRYQSVVIQDA
jgi:hypothetical protein